ncbi:Protein-glutamine gamma-glutamyltransferase K, partial [Acipenser ruthenus]
IFPCVLFADQILSVKAVDLLKSRSGINRQSHHTDEFEYDDLILRRGQSFLLEIEFSRPFNPDTDTVQLELQIGPLPQVSKGTHVIIPLVRELEDNQWEAKIVQRAGSRVKLSVRSPATAVIGRYKFAVTTHSSRGDFKMEHDPKNDITFLFNPWCERIPARCVTNFSSAHDSDVSLTTDLYFDEHMRPLTHLNQDSVWSVPQARLMARLLHCLSP